MSYTLTDLQQAFQAGLEEVFRRKKASLDIHQVRRALMNNPYAQRAIETARRAGRGGASVVQNILNARRPVAQSLSNTPENVSAAQQVLRSASKKKPPSSGLILPDKAVASATDPNLVNMGRTIQENWDKPHQLAAVYGQNFASPKEQQQLFEAANQGKQHREILNDKDYRESLLNSFNKVYYKNYGSHNYHLQSPHFIGNGGHAGYTATSYPEDVLVGNSSTELAKSLRGRRFMPALEGTALQDLSAKGIDKVYSDSASLLTSGARQTGYERNMEKYPGLIEVNPKFRQGKMMYGPLYKITDPKKLGENLQRDSGRNMELVREPVSANPGEKGNILFLPGRVSLEDKQRNNVYRLSDPFEYDQGMGSGWTIHRTHPEGFSRGSVYPKDKNFNADPEFIKKHKDQFTSNSDYNWALREAESRNNLKNN